MKITKKQLIVSIFSIAILITSLIVMLLDIFVPFNLWLHPSLNFLFCMLTGFGILLLILGVKNSFSWHCFVGLILLSLAIFYVLMQYLAWWISVITVFVVLCVVGLLCFVKTGNKTELSLNDDPSYKTYKERKKAVVTSEELEELPEIKSFK